MRLSHWKPATTTAFSSRPLSLLGRPRRDRGTERTVPGPPVRGSDRAGRRIRRTRGCDDRKTDYVRARDLEEHGDLVVQRIRTIVAANQEHSEVSDVHEQVANAAATLTAVQDATTDLDRSAEAKIGDVLEIAAERLEYPIGYVTRIDSGTQEIVAVTGDHDLLQPGATDPLGQTYCRKTIESDEPFVLEDAREEGGETIQRSNGSAYAATSGLGLRSATRSPGRSVSRTSSHGDARR